MRYAQNETGGNARDERASLGRPATITATKDVPAIEVALDSLGSEVAALRDVAEALVRRLGPVVAGDPLAVEPEPERGPGAPVLPGSGMRAQINCITAGVFATRFMLSRATEALEI